MRGNVDGLTKRQLLPADTTARARTLRRASTEPEKRMWVGLREAFPDAKWRRQVPIARYFADFCSHRERLVVEIDGDLHADAVDYDADRSKVIEGQGYGIARFTNADVMHNLDGVILRVADCLSPTEKGRP